MNILNSKKTIKCIIIGGSACGILSIIPIVNLLNLFFMSWMALGGGLSIYLLFQEKKFEIKVSESLLIGALTGAIGSIIFGFLSYLLIVNLSMDKIERIIALAEQFSSSMQEDVTDLLQGDQLKQLFFLFWSVSFLFSIISGAIGGLLSRNLCARSKVQSSDV